MQIFYSTIHTRGSGGRVKLKKEVKRERLCVKVMGRRNIANYEKWINKKKLFNVGRYIISI